MIGSTGWLTGSHGAPELFERAIALENKAEAGYFEYGRYLDSLMRDARQRQAAKAARARGGSNPTAAQPDRFNGRAKSDMCTLSLRRPGAMCRVSDADETGSMLAAWVPSYHFTLGTSFPHSLANGT